MINQLFCDVIYCLFVYLHFCSVGVFKLMQISSARCSIQQFEDRLGLKQGRLVWNGVSGVTLMCAYQRLAWRQVHGRSPTPPTSMTMLMSAPVTCRAFSHATRMLSGHGFKTRDVTIHVNLSLTSRVSHGILSSFRNGMQIRKSCKLQRRRFIFGYFCGVQHP